MWVKIRQSGSKLNQHPNWSCTYMRWSPNFSRPLFESYHGILSCICSVSFPITLPASRQVISKYQLISQNSLGRILHSSEQEWNSSTCSIPMAMTSKPSKPSKPSGTLSATVAMAVSMTWRQEAWVGAQWSSLTWGTCRLSHIRFDASSGRLSSRIFKFFYSVQWQIQYPCQGNTIISVTRPPTKIKQEREMRECEREEREIERREVWLNGSKRSHQW